MARMQWQPNLDLGAGYDRLSGEAKQIGVLGEMAEDPEAAGESGEAGFLLIQSPEEFDAALAIDAEIDVGVGPFGGSAKFGFRERSKVSSQATFCMVQINMTRAYERLRNPVLSDDASSLIADGKSERFRKRFGDGFVSGRWTGLEFYGSIRIEAKEQQRQLEIASEIQASYGLAISGEASMAYSKNEKSAEHQIQVSVFQKGGLVALALKLDDLTAMAQQALGDARGGRAYPFAVELDPYDELKLPNDDASFVDVEAARSSLTKLASHKLELERISNDIDFVLRNQGWFEDPDVARLNAANKQIANELNAVRDAARICSRDYAACKAYAPEYPELELPPRKLGAGQGQAVVSPPVSAPGQELSGFMKKAVIPWNSPLPKEITRIQGT